MHIKVVGILQNVEKHVSTYLGHYDCLCGCVEGHSMTKDKEKIEECISKLEEITENITGEIRTFTSIKNEILKTPANSAEEYKSLKSNLKKAQEHLNKALPPLNAYIEGLYAVKNNGHTAEQAKTILTSRAKDLRTFYEKFSYMNLLEQMQK